MSIIKLENQQIYWFIDNSQFKQLMGQKMTIQLTSKIQRYSNPLINNIEESSMMQIGKLTEWFGFICQFSNFLYNVNYQL